MIREAILQKIEERGISQAKLCDDLGLTRQNFSSFLTGRRSLPLKVVVDVMQHLNLTVGDADGKSAYTAVKEVPEIISRGLVCQGVTLKRLAEMCEISQSTISCFLNSKRNICVGNLEKMLKALDMGVVNYKSKRIRKA